MKKKSILITVLLACAFAIMLVVTACGPKTNNPTPGPSSGSKDTVSTKELSPLKDFQNAATATKVIYDATVLTEQSNKLQAKQADLVSDEDATDPAKQDGDRIDDADDDYSTYSKIFYRANADTILDRMATAGLEQSRMVSLVRYISRNDSPRTQAQQNMSAKDKIKNKLYIYEVGRESLLRDYEDVEELEEYYDDHSDDDEVYDALAYKRRKMSKESIQIFGEEADQYARTMLEELLYVSQIVDGRAAAYYGTLGVATEGPDNVDRNYIDYFRDVYFDYETLSYMEALNETVDLKRDSYTTNSDAGRKDYVHLYAYHYQYQKVDTETLTDDEHTRYLTLMHKSYMPYAEAVEYHDLDYKSYAQAYRYSPSFYTTYYNLHFTFQDKQEQWDREIYVGGSPYTWNVGSTSYTAPRWEDGLGYALTNSTTTYAGEMRKALQNIGSMLKIGDVEMEYFLVKNVATGIRTNINSMNNANTAWNQLSTDMQSAVKNKILKVNLELENLKQQKYVLTYQNYLSDSDYVNALQYQIYTYSADYIRAIQSYKKSDVTLNKELERLQAKLAKAQEDGATEAEISAIQTEIADKQEEIGRNTAMYENLPSNYANANVDGQHQNANNVEWSKIRSEIDEALNKDYETYHAAHQKGGDTYVDEYFENNLIKKKYTCGVEVGSGEACKNGDNHLHCKEEYDTECRISRLINNHQSVFRHAYGQVMVIYATHPNFNTYEVGTETDNKEYTGTYNATIGVAKTVAGAYLSMDADERPSGTGYYDSEGNALSTETIDSDEAPTLAHDSGSKWTSGSIYPNNNNLTSNKWTIDNNGTISFERTNSWQSGSGAKTYVYRLEFDGWFVDKDLKYRVREDKTVNGETEEGDRFSYDVRLYPGFRIYKMEKKA